jgi:1,5-anhydro-D-fructose reductase (1,5-anhydro-D-mannitol-forming)
MEKNDIGVEPITRRQALVMLAITPPFLLGLASDMPRTQSDIRRAGMIRLAMLSFWHVHAGDYLHQALANRATAITAIWDETPERGRTQAQSLGVPFYDNLHDLLAQADVDGVIVDTPTTIHRDVMVAAAQAGKHIFTEKVLAPTLRECNEIVAAVDKAGVKLMVSLPRLYAGSTLAIKEILDRKLLGEVTQVRTRASHDGALRTLLNPQGWLPPYFFNPQQTAGGAMIDLGAHPMYLARLFLGLPESVSANYGYITGRAVEDNAVVVLRYPQGAVGIVEAGFVNPFSPFTIEVHGTEGSLLYGTPESTLQIRSSNLGKHTSNNWSVWTDIPPDQPTAFQQWISHIQQGTTATENILIATDLSMLMEAANLSAKGNQPVRLDMLPSS